MIATDELPQFLYTIQPTRPEMLSEGATAEEAAIVSRHFRYLQQLTEENIVLLAGRTLNTDESSFGIVILQATEETAFQIMQNDPAVKFGVMKARLYPYRIALTAAKQQKE